MAKIALKEQNIEFKNSTVGETEAKIVGVYPGGKTANIIIYKVSDIESRVEIRVGTSEAGMENAKQIMENIIQHCGAATQ
jgi:hypothetical protein